MSFKDDVRADLPTFVEVTEFGELATIDGVILWAQIIPWTAEKSSRQNENYDGLFGDYVTIYFQTEPYVKKRKRLPAQGQWVYVNGKRYDVRSCRDELGITKLICAAYRQGSAR